MAPRTVVPVPVSSLHPHPLQEQLFKELPQNQFDDLRRDIEQHGLRQPILITSDNMVISGHQRLRVAKLLDWELIDAIVMEVQDPFEIQRLLILENLSRRQLSPLGLARIYVSLSEAARRREITPAFGALRNQIATMMGGRLSGRTLDRYRRLLTSPEELQIAVDCRQLSMTQVFRVLDLGEKTQKQIVEEIRAGQSPRDVVERHLRVKQTSSPEESAKKAYAQLIKALTQNLESIDKYSEKVVGTAIPGDGAHDVLTAAAKVCRKLADAERREWMQSARDLRRKFFEAG